MKYKNKTVSKVFTVFLVVFTVLTLIGAVTPLSFASVDVPKTPTQMVTDSKFPYLTRYFFGANSGIVDVQINSRFRRFVFDNQKITPALIHSGSTNYIWFTSQSSEYSFIYYCDMGSTWSSFTSTKYDVTECALNDMLEYTISYANIYACNCALQNGVNGSNAVQTSLIYSNCYYPFAPSSSVNLDPIKNNQSTIMDNQSTIIGNQSTIIQKENTIITKLDQLRSMVQQNNSIQNSIEESRYSSYQSQAESRASVQESQANSRASSQEEEANSRQSQIMNAGSDVTVSTIDNWIDGEGGLADRLTRFAYTLSQNASIFNQNYADVSEQLLNVKSYINGFVGKIPAPLISCCVAFLLILISVKVVGR